MIIQNDKEREALREGGKILAHVLDDLTKAVHHGMTTDELDQMAEGLIRKNGGEPSFKGYRVHGAPAPFPATLCVSINHEVVHGIPSKKRVFEIGDVVGLDIGMKYKGLFTDAARTVIVHNGGDTPLPDTQTEAHYFEAEHLVDATRKALMRGIGVVRAGVYTGDIGYEIERYLEDQGYGVVKELIGHGVGRKVHEDPEIPNWGTRGTGVQLREGEVIALEPMATLGKCAVDVGPDGWTWVTVDGSIAAHFEHTLIVTKDGAEVITQI
jgi:methionyl aminopeptidase